MRKTKLEQILINNKLDGSVSRDISISLNKNVEIFVNYIREQYPHLIKEFFDRCKLEDVENSGEISFDWFLMVVEINCGDDIDINILNVIYICLKLEF